MPYIKAKMVDDWILPSYQEGRIPIVTESDHPRFVEGARLDWGFVQVAIEDGWVVTIEPHDINRANCVHPQGFDRTKFQLSSWGEAYRLYRCPVCYVERGVLIKNEHEVVEHYPTDYNWDFVMS